MAVFIMTDAKTLIDGFDLSGITNNVTLTHSKELVEGTTFGFADNTRVRVPGLLNVELTQSGFVDYGTAGEPDQTLFAGVAKTADSVITLAPTSSVTTSPGPENFNPGYSFKALQGSYNANSAVNEIMGYDLTAQGIDRLIKGIVTENGSTLRTNVAETGVPAGGYNIGSGTGKDLYSVLHVTQADTTGTLQVDMHFAAGDTWPGTVRLEHSAFTTAVGAEWKEQLSMGVSAGPWWNATYSVTGATTGFKFYHMFYLT